jgi:hypothetical protein
MYPEPYPTLTRCEYRIKPWKKALSLMLGFPLAAGALFVIATSGLDRNRLPAGISALFFLAGGVYIIAWAFRSRLILDGTRIEVRTAFGERTAEFRDIEGCRTISTRYGTEKRLQLKSGGGTLTVSNDFETDGEFGAWMRRLPDLDNIDRESMLEEIKRREDLGAKPEERLGALANAKSIAIFASIAAVALALVLGFADPLLELPAGISLAAAPAVVFLLMRRSPLLYTIFKPKGDPRPDLLFVLMASSFGFLLAVRGVHLVSWTSLLPSILSLAAVYLAPVLLGKPDPTTLMGKVIACLFFAALYGYGVSVAVDASLDTRLPEPYRATVTGKHEYHGRSTTYTLYLAPWGPVEHSNRLNVTGTFYRATETGDQVCLDLYPGTLHVQWFRHVDCATQRGPADPQ